MTVIVDLIPDQIYEKNLDKTPNCQQVGTLASCFVEMARKDPTLATNIIAAYIKEDIRLAKEGKLNPNTIPNHVKPIKSQGITNDSKRYFIIS